jgi:hypothetical protein
VISGFMNAEAKGNGQVLFREVQRFAQPWLWVVVLAAAASAWFAAIVQLFAGASPERHLMSDLMVLLIWLLMGLGLPALFISARLVVEVRKDGLYYRYCPFHRTFHRIEYNDIRRFEARVYRPIMEYGGWGIRYGWKRGKAYNVSGNRGVQLELKDGASLLLGSQAPEELASAIAEATGKITNRTNGL